MKKLLPGVLAALLLAGCASVDDSANSQLAQSNQPDPEGATEAGDVAIAGQYFAHAINQLPEIANAPNLPLVRFAGVTSIITGPIDTQPYTELLRDRILLITREKLRFTERQLPQLNPGKHKKGAAPAESSPDFEIMAELRGNFEDERCRIQIQLVDYRTRQVVYNGLYRIHKEVQAPPPPAPGVPVDGSVPPQPSPSGGSTGF